MNCSEVMELMQRQLDSELEESDQVLLTEHLRSCSACADMFERLMRLKEGLEQLPKVMPTTSLVDFILPQLDEIDRLNAQNASMQETSNTETKLKIIELSPERQTNRHHSPAVYEDLPVVRSRWIDRFNWRTASAVVAAGVVFGLFIVNYDGVNSVEKADFTELSAERASASESLQDSNNNESMMRMRSSEELKAAKQAEPEAVAQDAGLESESVPTEQNNQQEAEAPQEQSSAESGGVTSSVSNGNQINEAPSADAPMDSNANDGPSEPINESDQPMSEEPAESLSTDQEAAVTGNDRMGISIVAPSSLELFSPDQAFLVAWENNELRLSAVHEQENVLIEALAMNSQPLELKWSEDSKRLIVVLESADGTTVEHVYDISVEGMKLVANGS